MNPQAVTAVIEELVPAMRGTGFRIGTAIGTIYVPPGREADQLADLLEHQQRLALIYAQCMSDAAPAAAADSATPASQAETGFPTAKERLQQFVDSGESVKGWAEKNGFGDELTAVYRVLNARSPARRGKHHDIAVKLGLKPTNP